MEANNSSKYESIEITLSEEKYPIAFANKVKELMQMGGMDEETAKCYVRTTPIELELYYEIGHGLFGLESEAIEANCTELCSPYTKEYFTDYKEEDD